MEVTLDGKAVRPMGEEPIPRKPEGVQRQSSNAADPVMLRTE